MASNNEQDQPLAADSQPVDDEEEDGCYERNAEANSELGLEYERLITANSLLDLPVGAKMAIQMSPAGKFDDEVIHVEAGGQYDGYYLRQMKHKQTINNPELTIKKIDLVADTGPYALVVYLDSFCKVIQNEMFYRSSSKHFPNDLLIKELSLVTNIKFDVPVLPFLIKVKSERHWAVPFDCGKCYKFNYAMMHKFHCDTWSNMMNQVTHACTMALGLQSVSPQTIIKTFFDLLVFEVNQPNVYGMREVVVSKMRKLIPIEMTEEQARRALDGLVVGVLKLFKERVKLQPTGKLQPLRRAKWATVVERRELIGDIVAALTRPSLLNEETDSLSKCFVMSWLNRFPHWVPSPGDVDRLIEEVRLKFDETVKRITGSGDETKDN